jgi:predicted metalloprotease with PDZ domain
MQAFLAAKRTALLVAGIFLMAAPLALADDSPGYLGVMLQDLDENMAKALQLEGKSGVIITDVVDDSPAAMSGLENGDVILMFNGKAVMDTGDLTKAVRASGAGEEVEMVILHNGKKQTLRVELGEHEGGLAWVSEGDGNVWAFKSDDGEDVHIKMLRDLHGDEAEVRVKLLKDLQADIEGDHDVIIKKMIEGDEGTMAFFAGNDRGFMGVSLDDVGGQMAEYFEVDGGALITNVNEDSPAAKAGLKAGDVIVKVGDTNIEDSADVHKAMQDTEPEQELKVKVMRKGDDKTIKVTLGEMPENMTFKNIQIHTDGDEHFSVTAPKMLMHGKNGGQKQQYRIMRTTPEGSWTIQGDDLDELKEELEKMKKELKEMKKELNK